MLSGTPSDYRKRWYPGVREGIIALSERIQGEIAQILKIRDLVFRRWQKALRDEDYLGSVAFDLHSFYQSVERIFESIAALLGRGLPSGDSWHKLLLKQMTEELPGIRPAVISAETMTMLDRYRTFRHVARNIYMFKLDPKKMQGLVENLPAAVDLVCEDLADFVDFLNEADAHGR